MRPGHFVQRLLVGLAVAGCGVGARGPASDPLARGTADDSVRTLPAPAGGTLRWPSAAWTDGGWVIAANVFPRGLARVAPRSLYLVHSRLGALPLPPGDFLFAHPAVLSAPDGVVHLVWAEGRPSVEPPGWPWSFRELWYARRSSAGWSAPEPVRRGQYIGWESRGVQAVLDRAGRLHLVAVAADSNRQEAIEHYVRDDGGWHRAVVGFGLYPTIASVGPDRLVVAFVRGEPDGAVNQLATTVSADDGRTWSRPVRVLPASDTAEAYHPVLRAGGDSLSLAWHGSALPSGTVVRLSRSSVDVGGRTTAWRMPASSEPIPGVLVSVSMAGDACGDVPMLAEVIRPTGVAAVLELRARGANIAAAREYAPALAPTLARGPSNMLKLWSGVRPPGDSVQPMFRELRGAGRKPSTDSGSCRASG